MTKAFILRKGEITDFDALFYIYMDKEINRYLNFEIMSKEKFKEVFNDLMNSGELYVYELNKEIAATCIVMRQKRRANHVVSLGTLATKSELQGKGIGTQFMKELIHKLQSDGIKRIDLCVETDNPIGLNFYKKLGFQSEGILKKYFKRPYEDKYIDEHPMALIIG